MRLDSSASRNESSGRKFKSTNKNKNLVLNGGKFVKEIFSSFLTRAINLFHMPVTTQLNASQNSQKLYGAGNSMRP